MKVAGTVYYRRSRARGRRPSETTRSNDAWVTPFLDFRPSSNSPDMPGYAGVIVVKPLETRNEPAGAARRFPPGRAADGAALPAPGSGRVYDNGFADNGQCETVRGSPRDSTRLLLVSWGDPRAPGRTPRPGGPAAARRGGVAPRTRTHPRDPFIGPCRAGRISGGHCGTEPGGG